MQYMFTDVSEKPTAKRVTIKMEAADFSETMVLLNYQTALFNILEVRNINYHRRENRKAHKTISLL
jgi:hypothetical protein